MPNLICLISRCIGWILAVVLTFLKEGTSCLEKGDGVPPQEAILFNDQQPYPNLPFGGKAFRSAGSQDCTFSVAVPVRWNKVPPKIWMASTLLFKRAKTPLTSSYIPCFIFICYVLLWLLLLSTTQKSHAA